MSEMLVPHIPADAPFTPAQRAWLNGFLAGLYSYAPAPAAEAAHRLRVALLYGSQTGTAEGLARKLSKELKAAGFEVALNSLEGYVPATLATERNALFIVSTYGEGEPPDSAQAFFQQLCIERFPMMGNLSYAVLSLGDSHYEHFCQFGKDLDAKLESLGATRVLDRVESDVDVDGPYKSWKTAVGERLRSLANPRGVNADTVQAHTPFQAPVRATRSAVQRHSRENPYHAQVSERRVLTHSSSSKLTIHLNFAVEGSCVSYEAGDACGVIPRNSPDLVDSVLGLLPFSGDEPVDVPKTGSFGLRDALMEKLTITRLTRNMISRYAARVEAKQLEELLAPDQQAEFERWVYGRDLFDLLSEYPGGLAAPSDLVEMLPRLSPRLYSISSSPAAHPQQIHTTISVVRYRTHNRNRGGVCSTLLADRIEVGDCLPIYIQPNKKFRLPASPAAPVIMIGPGTGIAPFRGFLHERLALGAAGRNWLFFGDRSAATDFLYREELEAMHADGHLTELDTAFSRDQAEKVYVQDQMLKKARQFWAWLEEGAYVYVCGDASRMAKDVDRAIHKIAEVQGGLSPEVAEHYVHALKDDHRYQRDVY